MRDKSLRKKCDTEGSQKAVKREIETERFTQAG